MTSKKQNKYFLEIMSFIKKFRQLFLSENIIEENQVNSKIAGK
jgi:hypothetical protein